MSFPISWNDLDDVTPDAFRVRTVVGLLDGADPWRVDMPAPQRLPADLVAQGHTIPIARVLAMHEGKRRKRSS